MVKLEYVSFVESQRGVATVVFKVPQRPDSLNGYQNHRLEATRVCGTTAFKLSEMVVSWQQAYPPNSNVVRYYPRELIQFEEPSNV